MANSFWLHWPYALSLLVRECQVRAYWSHCPVADTQLVISRAPLRHYLIASDSRRLRVGSNYLKKPLRAWLVHREQKPASKTFIPSTIVLENVSKDFLFSNGLNDTEIRANGNRVWIQGKCTRRLGGFLVCYSFKLALYLADLVPVISLYSY
jgi:hypothetical protein